ncbi:MAG TPA: cytochrome c peroxidase [Bacteroidia bacterium]|nr:cytochrome c peroxidase [Bacteroidia bacterium]
MKTLYIPLLIAGGLIILLLARCKDPVETPAATPYELPQPKYFPTINNSPSYNPMTREGVKLGRYLFYDGRLNGRTHCDSMMSCYKCHDIQRGFVSPETDGKGTGVSGLRSPHTVLPLVNLAYRNLPAYGWNGSLKSIEDVGYIVFSLDFEFNTTFKAAVETLKKIPIYPPMFKAAFGTEEITIDRIVMALSQFLRSLVSYNSKYDKYIRKEIPSLSPQEMRGYQLFMSEKADCFHCHGDPALLTTNLFYNNALDSVFNKIDDRYAVTGNPTDIGAFKAPTLRNVALRNAFMHDGRFKTLEEVVDHYSEGLLYSPTVDPLMKWIAYGGTQLKENEKQDLIAFLYTLTDSTFISNPDFKRPPDLDTGCPE